MWIARITMLAALGLSSQCSVRQSSSMEPALVTGPWGGVHVSLALSDSGGSVRYDCAHGAISGPVRTDRRGKFDVAGVHVRERGGPVRMNERAAEVPARYVGVVTGDRMTLRVLVGADTLGPFELTRDGPARIVRCL